MKEFWKGFRKPLGFLFSSWEEFGYLIGVVFIGLASFFVGLFLFGGLALILK